jgi:hypothetical protein
MKKTLLLCGALLALTASTAFATSGTVQLTWNDCGPDGGVASTTWPCTANSTALTRFVGSFSSSKQMDFFVAQDVTVDAQFGAASVPDWWQMGDAPACRAGSFSLSLDTSSLPGAGASCPDTWDAGASATGLITLYEPGFGGANRVRVKLAIARSATDGVTLSAGQEYTSFILRFNRAKTVGTPSCAGCNTPVSIVLNSIILYNNPPAQVEADAWTLFAPGPSGNCSQGNGGDLGTCAATPARNKTWGAVKALYR